jgi:hypothetical protein
MQGGKGNSPAGIARLPGRLSPGVQFCKKPNCYRT